MKSASNRFALLASGDKEISVKEEVIDEDLKLTGPVTYSFETSQWSLDNTIYQLRQFKLQNITADKRGTIFLRFSHEAQAKQVVNYLTTQIKINAKITRVSNSRADPKCCYCSRLGHWASECQESLLSMFPSELITLISAELRAPDLFDFMLCSKTVFNAIANRQRTIIVARSHWHAHYRMKLKLGLLKYFKSVERLMFRSLRCVATAIPMNVIATQYTRLTSLTINNCSFINPSDYNVLEELDKSWVSAMARMTQLTKLDLDDQNMSMYSYKTLLSATQLTQLRASVVHLDFSIPVARSRKVSYANHRELEQLPDPVYDRTVPVGVKKLSIHSTRTANLTIESDQFKSLYLYHVGLITEVPLLSLERLIAPYKVGVYDAPNLTKLALYSTSSYYFYGDWQQYRNVTLDLQRFSKLKTLLLDKVTEAVDFSGLLGLRKLTLSYVCANLDLSSLINLKTLHLVEPAQLHITNMPESLKVLRITYSNYIQVYQLPSNEFASLNITRFECLLTESSKGETLMEILPEYLNELVHCNTLREMKIEYDNEKIIPYYAKFTQLHTLDLVQSSKRQIHSMPSIAPPREHIIELSKQLPNTRIYHGYNLPTNIQRPKQEHWYYQKIENSYLVPFDCGCEYCKAYERGYYEEEFDSKQTEKFDPKPFKEHWSSF